MNWQMEANYICPSVVHLAECVLQTSSPTTLIQHPQTTKLSMKNVEKSFFICFEI
jgi:hypothetical protein